MVRVLQVLGLLLAAVGLVIWFLLTASGLLPADAEALSPAERGAALAAQRGCIACHSLDGKPGIGPTWQGAYGSLRVFADGTSQAADEPYLRESMQQPAARVVQGYDNLMLPAALTEAEMADIMALLRELTHNSTP